MFVFHVGNPAIQPHFFWSLGCELNYLKYCVLLYGHREYRETKRNTLSDPSTHRYRGFIQLGSNHQLVPWVSCARIGQGPIFVHGPILGEMAQSPAWLVCRFTSWCTPWASCIHLLSSWMIYPEVFLWSPCSHFAGNSGSKHCYKHWLFTPSYLLFLLSGP